MNVAVIIPTYNGAKKIVRALDALAEQTFQDFIIYIVIDGSTDNTLDVVNTHSINTKIKVIVQENGGRSVAKNRGVLESSEELLIFLDDDMIPCKEFVEEHRKHHLNFPGTILTGGLENHNDMLLTEFGRFSQYLHEKWVKDLNDIPIGENMNDSNFFVVSGNCSMARYIFSKVGGFDIRLNDAEDYLFSVQANKKKILMYYSKLPWAYHYELKSCSIMIKRQREYFISQRMLFEIDHLLINNSRYLSHDLNFIKKWIFLLFTFKIWVLLIDKNLLSILPQKLKYKIYDLVVTANGVYFPDRVKL